MRDTKRRMENFSFYDRAGMEERLTRMAEKGWLLEKIGQFFWTYRRIEPKALAFSVCYFPKASQFDPGPSEEQETFYDFCAHTGWVLAASNAQLQIFYNERENPIPIETDPVTEVETIHKSMKRSLLPSCGVAAALSLLLLWNFPSRLDRDFIGTLSNAGNFMYVVCYAVLLLLLCSQMIGYLLWYRKAARLARQGEFYSGKYRQWFSYLCLGLVLAAVGYFLLSAFAAGDKMMMAVTALMFLLYLPGIFLAVNGIKGFLKERGASQGVNRTATFVGSFAVGMALIGGITALILYGSSHGWFARKGAQPYTVNGHTWTAYSDPLPLTLADLSIPVEESLYSRERTASSSPLLGKLTAEEEPRFGADREGALPELEYTVVEVKLPFLYERCKEQLLHKRDIWNERDPEGDRYVWSPVDPGPWGAAEAYCQRDTLYEDRKWFLLCYQDRLVELFLWLPSGDWTPTGEQMALVGERLGGFR